MMTLIQFPWSPFCISVRRILERHKIPHRIQNISYHDRSAIIKATAGRAYTVPCLIDGKTVVADFTDFGQEVARHIDRQHGLKLFPRDREGIQAILSRYIENDIEAIGFKINDSHLVADCSLVERVMLIRHKERKFGRGCVQQWVKEREKMTAAFKELLVPFDNILSTSPYLTGECPLFVDYDLYGILGNFLASGKTKLPSLKHLRHWHARM